MYVGGVRDHAVEVEEDGVVLVAGYGARHRSPPLGYLLFGCRNDGLGGKAEFALQFLERRRRPKGLHANGAAGAPDIARPAQRGGLFHRDARGHRRWQHVLAILRMLATVVLEDLPRGHADHAGLDALGLELFIRLEAQRDLAAGRQQQHLGGAVLRLGQDIRATLDALRRGIGGAIQGRQRLAGQDQGHGLVAELHDHPPGFDDLVGIRRAQGDQPRDGAQGEQLFHRLVRWPIFPHADRVVRKDVEHRDFHQGTQAHRPPRVVAEDQEPRAERPQLRQG